MEQQQFQENVSEWIVAVNSLLKELQEEVDNIGLAQEEDLLTLSYQYKILKDLRKRVAGLEYDNAIKNQIIMALKNKL